jgi:predicted transposase/invertase (TIGR01784 family)
VRRDAIYYQLFQRFPSLFFTLLDQPPPQASEYRFESVEVKEPTFRIDGVFLPPETASPRLVFFTEVQFQKDGALYHRFFSESLLYLYRNRTRYDDWFGVVILASRSVEPENTRMHRSLLEGPQVQRLYLDELGDPTTQPLGISLMQLTLASEQQMVAQAKQLLDRVQQEDLGTLSRQEIMEVITTIAVYKFARLSREEVEAMLGLMLEETRIYQEAKAEGRVEGRAEGRTEGRVEGREERQAELLAATVPLLLSAGLTIEQIANQLKVEVEAVRRAAQEPG